MCPAGHQKCNTPATALGLQFSLFELNCLHWLSYESLFHICSNEQEYSRSCILGNMCK